MYYFKKIISAFFSTLYRQVVIILGKKLSLPLKSLICLMYAILIVRIIIISICLYFDITAYFKYDDDGRVIYESSIPQKYLLIIYTLVPLFCLRLFHILYIKRDRQI